MSRTISSAVTVLASCTAFLLASVHAGDWPGWRGPTGMGLSDEKDLPLTWDKKTGENVVWRVALAGTTGHSSPIVCGDRVIITTAVKQTNEQEKAKEVPEHHMACYQVADGKLLWKTPVPPGKEPAGYAIYAVPTPVTDGKMIYAWYGSGAIAAVDLDGKLVWRKERPGPYDLNPGICTSPILYQDTVILLCDQGRGKGWLQGLDKATGEVKWEQKRAKMGCNNTTPLLIQVNGKPQMVILGSEILQGLDPANGEPIWWCKSLGFGESPVFGSGLVYVDKAGNELAMAVDPAGQGDVAQTHVKWRIPKSAGDYSSAVIAGDCIYKVRKEGSIACLKLAAGEEVFSGELPGVSKLASPFATADGRIYFVSTGKSYVIKAGPALEILGKGDLGGSGNGSSPAVAQGRIFVRDFEYFYCLGKKQ
ncbi:MAG: PQQ-binding-like beta-propeller repeat protein [Planctomycetota bacterium]|nr:PQQ-binding-like beta-propeller repeat protein [Planctomycetota bacterium]